MDVHEFHKDFLEEVKATAATEGSGSNAAFVSVASSYLVKPQKPDVIISKAIEVLHAKTR